MNINVAVPPNNPEAERGVLGGCLISEDALVDVIGLLAPDDFSDTNNKLIYSAIQELFINKKPVDMVTVSDTLSSKGLLERVGGMSYLTDIAGDVQTTANVTFYADIVRELSKKRSLIAAGKTIASLAASEGTSSENVIAQAEQLLLNASGRGEVQEFWTVNELTENVLADLEATFKKSAPKRQLYSTPFTDFDNLTGGLQQGALNVLAARPSMGKTALALNIAQFGASSNDKPVLVFSLEMPASQIAQRMISAQSGISLSKIISGKLASYELDRVAKACEFLNEGGVYISDNSTLSTTDFMIKCRRFKAKHPGLSLIVVDYLQLMSIGRRIDNRNLEVSEISRTLKAVARELNVPVLALSQLSRAAESRTDKKPQLSDLRDSGSIEQDADLVMLLYREDYYSDNENTGLMDSRADLRIAKNRNGATGMVHLTFKREITRFVNYGEE